MKIIIQLIAAFFGSFGFALLFNAKVKYAVIGAFGGLCSWGVYLIAQQYLSRVFFICLIASFFAALFSEICAKTVKAPASIFFTTAVLPLIPGSMLYYTLSNVVISDWEAVTHYGFLTAEFAFSIAIGGSFVWGSNRIIHRIIKKYAK